jgi:hypothetical protein
LNGIVRDEITHVLRFVLRRPARWATKDAEQFREQLEDLIERLADELADFPTHDDFGYERELPCEVQKAIAEAVTGKWPAYPGHMHKIEEICQGVIYCLRLTLLARRESLDQGRMPRRPTEANGKAPTLWEPHGQAG